MATPAPASPLTDRYRETSSPVLLTGIQSLVRVLVEHARMEAALDRSTATFVSGYEGSPLGGLDLELGRNETLLHTAGIVFQPGVNEELAATAVAGTQSLGLLPGRRYDGVTGIWYGKSPGLDRAADAIRHGTTSGTAPLGGCVAWIGDDPASKSSTIPSSSLSMCRSLSMPILTPGTVSELIELGLHAIAMSRYAGLWTGVQVISDVADGSATIDVSACVDAVRSVELIRTDEFRPWLMVPPQNLDAEADLLTVRTERALEYGRHARFNRITSDAERPALTIVGAGYSHAAIVRALDELGFGGNPAASGIRVVKLGMPWPIDRRELAALCQGSSAVLVVEDKVDFVESLVRDSLYGTPDAPPVVGRRDLEERPLLPVRGAVAADDVVRAIGRLLAEEDLPHLARERIRRVTQRRPIAIISPTQRAPFLCSGCPHNVSTRAEPDQLVGLGIGCHTLVAMDPVDRRGHITGITQMGGEGANWLGLAPFTDDRHFIQNLGDGTFHHSGSLAVRAAVASGANLTYKLLYNDAVAMTGGQRPQGRLAIPELTTLLRAEGVARIAITTPDPATYKGVRLARGTSVHHRDDLQRLQREFAEVPGVTVIVHDDRCATEKRRLRKRGQLESPKYRIAINDRVCEGCGDCVDQSTCLSLVPRPTEFGLKTEVHQSSCNLDESCVKGDCPSFLEVVPGQRVDTRLRAPDDLPTPAVRVGPNVRIRIPGVGGTGVVTSAAVLQMAANLQGLSVSGLDQTGLAQKGGQVVSDIRFGPGPPGGQIRATTDSVDVLLAFDLLGAVTADTLDTARGDRTTAIVNSSVSPTIGMVSDAQRSLLDVEDLLHRVSSATRAADMIVVDASRLAEATLGDAMFAGSVMLGVAYQHGCLPVTATSIEEALRLNGAAVENNIEAFRWGRAFVAAPHALPSTARHDAQLTGFPDIVASRVEELVRFQSPAYAARYEQEVVGVMERVAAVLPGDERIPIAFARHLYKVMAYKDEYEVARLHLEHVTGDGFSATFGKGASVRFVLHPPLLRALGMKRKIRIGRGGVPALRALHGMRRVRGTVLDPFRFGSVRRAERELISTYRDAVRVALTALTPETAETVLQLVELPDVVRGYEHIKLASLERFHEGMHDLLEQLSATPRT